jgi:hypothetical protein
VAIADPIQCAVVHEDQGAVLRPANPSGRLLADLVAVPRAPARTIPAQFPSGPYAIMKVVDHEVIFRQPTTPLVRDPFNLRDIVAAVGALGNAGALGNLNAGNRAVRELGKLATNLRKFVRVRR